MRSVVGRGHSGGAIDLAWLGWIGHGGILDGKL